MKTWQSSSLEAMKKDKLSHNLDSIKTFYNKNGTLTRYALACGYTEVYRKGNISIRLFKEDACYHVQVWGSPERHWESFPLLSEARKAISHYRSII